jgi:hypothetical protein
VYRVLGSNEASTDIIRWFLSHWEVNLEVHDGAAAVGVGTTLLV